MNKTHIYLIIAFLSMLPVRLFCQSKVIVLESGFIYDKAAFPQCHASSILETEDGLIACWFGETHEKHLDVCIYTSLYNKGKWDKPKMVADGRSLGKRYPCWNPVLFRLQNGDIALFYKIGPDPRHWWGLYKISKDEGRSWSSAVKLPSGFLGPIKNKAVQVDESTILYPTSIEYSPSKWRIYMETSDNNLKDWRMYDIDNNGFNAIQPTILFHPDGKIQLLCRSQEDYILTTFSNDKGRNWTPLEATSLPNNNSGIDGVTLPDGTQLLVYNPITSGRNKLALAVSTDGQNWIDLLMLEDHSDGEFSYPAIICGKDGTVHITYTYNRQKIKYVRVKFEK